MLDALAALALGALLLVHLATCAAVALRWRRARAAPVSPSARPPVTIVRAVCGLEHGLEECLASTFALAWPQVEIVFCAADPADPAVPLVERLLAAHPGANARLLVGGERRTANPKLDNVEKGWHAACHDLVVLADGNIRLPADYVARLHAGFDEATGLVSACAVGTDPRSLAGELECAVLNTHQARFLHAADMLGLGFAQGKTLMMRRCDIARAGGFEVLGAEIAEDSAATKAISRLGLRVRILPVETPHPVGPRRLREVWGRQVRWARLRRAAFPLPFALEIASGALVPLVLAAALLPLIAVPALAVVWVAAEIGLARAVGWPLSWRMPLLILARDLLLMPAVWIAGLAGSRYDWRGNAVDVSVRAGAAEPRAPDICR